MRNAACNPRERPANIAAMTENGTIGVGDRVVHLQVAGVFIVLGRRGRMLDVESDRGLRMMVSEISVRRLDGAPPEPKDA
jgi:hypothetical protein